MNKTIAKIVLATLLTSAISACDDGKDGVAGAPGQQGQQGIAGQAGQNGENASTALSINLVARAVLNAQSPEGAAEIVQYHKSSGFVYAINSSGDAATVDILDLPNANKDELTPDAQGVITNTNMVTIGQIALTENTQGDANSIAISDDLNLLAVAIAAKDTGVRGHIAFYDIAGAAPVFIKNIEVGFLPDMVAFSPDSTKVVVANEGEPSGDYTVDPEGSISIITVTDGDVANTAINLDFRAYNDKKNMLESQGVMFANPHGRTIKGQLIQTSVAMDLEPEYVAISEDSSKAYVSLQENNALATIDLTTNTLESVKGLGFKSWQDHKLDASDKDGGLHLKSYQNLYGMYQPDTLVSYSWKGANFIITANEGDGREYFFEAADEASCKAQGGLDFDEDDGCLAYTDESRAEDLTLDAIAFSQVNNDDDDIGRLKVSTVKGDIDSDGDYDKLYTYGARSFSIWDENGTIVFDSGDDIVKITSAIHGEAFNNDEDENKGDTRSDAKGAEPEALAIGTINDKTYAFIGLERMAGILIYDVTNPFKAEFVDYFINRGTTEKAEITGDLAPEGMKFIEATESSSAKLIVGNEISGSVSVWQIDVK